MKLFNLSQKKVTTALNIFFKVVDKIEKANKLLERGVDVTQKKFDDTTSEVKVLQSKLDDLTGQLDSHKAEIQKNADLIAKFKEFTK
jgi:peptidoglycan hydrolase CwlO-like protein